VVVAETPRLAPHRDEMRARLAGALGIAPDDVSLKGKTNELMGVVGRGEGIACVATATIVSG
jgi:2-C-methyl-D-erythritol 2,4-cyclodiphosphate synthase